MYFSTFLYSLTVVDFTVINDLFNHKNLQHVVNLNANAAVLAYDMFYKTNKRFSSYNKNNCSIKIPYSYQKVGIVLNTSNEDWMTVFDSLDLSIVFKSPFTWVVITEDLDGTAKLMSQYPIEVDSDVTIIFKKDEMYNLYEIFNTGFALNGDIVLRKVGYWDNTLHIEKKDRLDLNGLVLRTTLVITKDQKVGHKTFIEFLDNEQPNLTTVDSIHKLKYYEILKYYRDMFNISFQRSNSWGYPTNGSFDGMVGALQRFEADIGGSPIFMRTDRSLAVDYAAETWQTRPCFIFRHPKHPSGYYTIYTRPLSTKVWYCITAFLVLSAIILCSMLRVKRIKVEGDEREESPSMACLFIWGAICQQGVTINRSSASIKVVVFVTFISAITLYQYYNALVVSALLQAPPKNIRTMEDLLKSNLKAGVEDVLYNKDFFKRTTDPLAIKMYNKRIVTKTEYNFYSAEIGMALVKQGGFAFHVDSAVAYRIMQRAFSANELCDATEIPMYGPQNTGAGVAKRSPYKEHIAYGIRKMKERGIMRRLQNLWDASRPACARTPDSSLISVSLLEFQTALVALAVGYLAAAIVLTFEILVKAVENSKTSFCSNC